MSAADNARATGKATQPSVGVSHSCSLAIASAANSTIAPWAKLNTPEALKISTKPSATSEYSTPVRRPPSSTSRNGPMGSPSVAHAEIGRSEEQTSELQSLMRISYADFCLKKKTQTMRYNYKD